MKTIMYRNNDAVTQGGDTSKSEEKKGISLGFAKTTSDENKENSKKEGENKETVTSNSKDVPIKKIETERPKMTFPREISKIVYLRRIPMPARLPGQNLDESKLKVGSSFRGASVLRGLEFTEEVKYLPQIIGISTGSANWETETRNYWANISKEVPPKEGVQLEIGMRYFNQEDYDYDMGLITDSDSKEFIRKDHNGTTICLKGSPINLSDYIMWRYCLLYSKVANTQEDIGKSPKIEFYLFSKDKEITDKKASLNSKKKAIQLMYQRMSERDWVDYVLRVLIAQDQRHLYTVKQVETMGEDEKDILLDEFVQENADRFILIANDRNLEMKAFLEVAIALGKLSRIPNTQTIIMDGSSIGNTIDEAVSFLNNPKNNQTLSTLRAQTRLMP